MTPPDTEADAARDKKRREMVGSSRERVRRMRAWIWRRWESWAHDLIRESKCSVAPGEHEEGVAGRMCWAPRTTADSTETREEEEEGGGEERERERLELRDASSFMISFPFVG